MEIGNTVINLIIYIIKLSLNSNLKQFNIIFLIYQII